MSNEKFKIGNLSGKGLIIAAAASILVVGAAGFYSYSRISDKLNAEIIGENRNDTLSADGGNSDSGGTDINAPVDAAQTDIVKKETSVTVTETEPAESAAVTAEASEREKPSAVQTEPFPTTMVRPLNGEVLNDFSAGELVKSKTLNVWKTHDGVDIAGAMDEKVKSMTSGTVTKVYEDQMMGACVIIDHGNGFEGYYCNLSKDIPVSEGQKVSAGTVIGAVGNTAQNEISEAPHLHFAIKKNGEWIDPIALISGEGS
ncbi:MAG: M23 family metallopeptidase [Oscillospiraceae bacterium]|nr:M23 family metallopeptidase [Oscillospiraceae bacterium]